MCVLMEAHSCVSQPYVLWYSMLSEDLLLGTRLWSMSNAPGPKMSKASPHARTACGEPLLLRQSKRPVLARPPSAIFSIINMAPYILIAFF